MTLTRPDVGGWILRCLPERWDLDAARAADGAPLPFALQATYRAGLVAPGDPAFLWVGGAGGTRGLAATGTVTEESTERIDERLWRDPERASQPAPYVMVAWRFLPEPLRRPELRQVWDLRGLELLRVPRALNPSVVRPRELRALQRLVGAAVC